MIKDAFLTLENGMMFKGQRFGYDGEAVGELVFSTAMTGYLETITDPAYFGQVVMQTFPLIGNYGVIPADFERDKPQIKAYIVRDHCDKPSNFRSEGVLDIYLKESKIPGLCNIDTRSLTRVIREHGVMNAKISSQPLTDEEIKALKDYSINDVVKSVSCIETKIYNESPEQKKVVVWDFGTISTVIKAIADKGYTVICVPYNTKADEILSLNADGVIISNGPGDPSENTDQIAEIRKVLDRKIPTFGMGLGHQLMALAMGGKTEKLKYGHRGANQPVIDVVTNKVLVTSQNHGYVVVSDSLPEQAHIRFVNSNDKSCEAIEYTDIPALSTQFFPELTTGPLDVYNPFEKFLDIVNEGGAR
ncbi:MAG: carbamoyl phosphate synthase small subunit [Eubacteriales bacterium]|nr:carbamoyl phosphate synthase small subunit [Eubacteriales bacterium]